jgi:hypothetical protein
VTFGHFLWLYVGFWKWHFVGLQFVIYLWLNVGLKYCLHFFYDLSSVSFCHFSMILSRSSKWFFVRPTQSFFYDFMTDFKNKFMSADNMSVFILTFCRYQKNYKKSFSFLRQYDIKNCICICNIPIVKSPDVMSLSTQT